MKQDRSSETSLPRQDRPSGLVRAARDRLYPVEAPFDRSFQLQPQTMKLYSNERSLLRSGRRHARLLLHRKRDLLLQCPPPVKQDPPVYQYPGVMKPAEGQTKAKGSL